MFCFMPNIQYKQKYIFFYTIVSIDDSQQLTKELKLVPFIKRNRIYNAWKISCYSFFTALIRYFYLLTHLPTFTFKDLVCIYGYRALNKFNYLYLGSVIFPRN